MKFGQKCRESIEPKKGNSYPLVKTIEILYESGWYPEETSGQGSYRWMQQEARCTIKGLPVKGRNSSYSKAGIPSRRGEIRGSASMSIRKASARSKFCPSLTPILSFYKIDRIRFKFFYAGWCFSARADPGLERIGNGSGADRDIFGRGANASDSAWAWILHTLQY